VVAFHHVSHIFDHREQDTKVSLPVAGEGIRSPVAAVDSNLVERGVGSMAAAVGYFQVQKKVSANIVREATRLQTEATYSPYC